MRCLLLLLGFVFSPLLFAQSDRGTITGTVSDAAGAVAPNAAVVATNSETGVVSRTETTGTGNVSVEVPGFKKYIRQGVRVQVAETARVDLTLEVGATTESVTVSAE